MSETQELRFSVMPGVDVCCRTPAGAPYAFELIKVLEAPIRQFQRMQSAPLLREFASGFIESSYTRKFTQRQTLVSIA